MENSTPEPKQPDKSNQKLFGALAMEAGIEFALLIGAPLIGFVLLGRWLDTKFNHHFFVLIGLFVALALSS